MKTFFSHLFSRKTQTTIQKKSWFRQHRILTLGLLIALLPIGYSAYKLGTYVYEQTTTLSAPPEEIVGSKVTLRKLTESNYLDYHNMFSNEVRRALEFPEVITLGYTIQYLRGEQKKANEGSMLMYLIFDNKDKKLIGSLEIRDKNEDDPGQFGIWVNEAYWGGGRSKEAFDLIAKTYFRLKPHEKSFIAHVRLWNQRSYHACKKFGFKEIGYFYEGGKPTRYILEYTRP